MVSCISMRVSCSQTHLHCFKSLRSHHHLSGTHSQKHREIPAESPPTASETRRIPGQSGEELLIPWMKFLVQSWGMKMILSVMMMGRAIWMVSMDSENEAMAIWIRLMDSIAKEDRPFKRGSQACTNPFNLEARPGGETGNIYVRPIIDTLARLIDIPGLNLTGFVWTVDQDSHNTVTVEFYDHEFHRDFHFTDPYLYDKACLSMLLYCSTAMNHRLTGGR